MKRAVFFFLGCIYTIIGYSQYAPQVGLKGCDAIGAASSLFRGWATGCNVQRGFMDIANPSLGYASTGDSSLATGKADGYTISLGDSGIAVLTFSHPIYNGPGVDFAVFENGFRDPVDSTLAFLELAFVEVSSDGKNYYRFPASSLTEDTVQIASEAYLNAAYLNNLAGKYIGQYGTPFDLQELAGTPGLDIDNITHVRIIDVVGSISGHTTYDNNERKVNDPYPTPYPSSGFDLDAVGVINQKTTAVGLLSENVAISLYPNPVTDKVTIALKYPSQNNFIVTISDITGKVLIHQSLLQPTNDIPLTQYCSGIYFIALQDANGNRWTGKIVKL